ncbi:MAG TPA: hypothetical protein PKD17_13775 [Cellvibrionaceae bacterium]|nr:hypothetical protein [Cellvibrionaceae bacterium]HMW72888.1 hypothetical protein [Cellvibrionaceae bacterium]HMY38199.1 hypothetical protein [Marinagarivorans sp.]HNG60005.1 hypothetical protein [Cellvibrionaceae bacterium]
MASSRGLRISARRQQKVVHGAFAKNSEFLAFFGVRPATFSCGTAVETPQIVRFATKYPSLGGFVSRLFIAGFGV